MFLFFLITIESKPDNCLNPFVSFHVFFKTRHLFRLFLSFLFTNSQLIQLERLCVSFLYRSLCTISWYNFYPADCLAIYICLDCKRSSPVYVFIIFSSFFSLFFFCAAVLCLLFLSLYYTFQLSIFSLFFHLRLFFQVSLLHFFLPHSLVRSFLLFYYFLFTVLSHIFSVFLLFHSFRYIFPFFSILYSYFRPRVKFLPALAVFFPSFCYSLFL